MNLVNGMAYIPIHRGSKRPTAPDWNLKENCITRPEETHKLDGMNIGLAHAYCDPVTCCIDVDHLPSASKWFADRGIDLMALLTSSGAIAESGRKNSLKAYYTLPTIKTTRVVKVDGRVAFEFRCATKDGKTVCDVIPPSLHPKGTIYQWIGSKNLTSLEPIPNQLLSLWEEVGKTEHIAKSTALKKRYRDFTLDSPSTNALLRSRLAYINPDCDYETWRDVVFAVLSTRFTDAVSIAESWSEGSSKFDQRAFNTLIDSYKAGSFSVGTIYYYSNLGGYRGN